MLQTASDKVKIEALHTNEKRRFFSAVNKALRNREPYFYIDRDITYSITYENTFLMISAAEESSLPNASIYPVLMSKYGEADMTCVKNSSLNPRVKIFNMGWQIDRIRSS
jgi:hypothetical protein